MLNKVCHSLSMEKRNEITIDSTLLDSDFDKIFSLKIITFRPYLKVDEKELREKEMKTL